jgi:hypothetical protein
MINHTFFISTYDKWNYVKNKHIFTLKLYLKSNTIKCRSQGGYGRNEM